MVFRRVLFRSQKAMSGVLMQEDDKKNLKPIGYWAKTFKGSQKNWAALVMEARAVLEAVQHFAVFVTGCTTVLKCDHKPLARFLEMQTKNVMVNRWSLLLQEFDLKFEWVATDMNVSDCLSRLGADSLFLQHENVDSDFPAFPKSNNSEDKGVQMDTGTVCPVAVVPRCKQQRRNLDPYEEAEMMGMMEKLEIKDYAHLSDNQVKYLQQKDNYCKRIKDRAGSFNEANGEFQMQKGLLYKHFHSDHPGKERISSLALVIPKCLCLSVVLNLHKELNHPGRDKMLAVLKTRVYWKHMNTHVAEFVKGCKVCQFRHLKNSTYTHMRIKPPRGPAVKLAIDCWSGGGGIALTAICLHSQYPFAEELTNKEAKQMCNAMQNILAYIRAPLEVISDNGGEFTSESFETMLTRRGIKHTRVAPYSPQSNGVLERFHGYLNSSFRTTVNLSKEGEWWPAVRSAVETYRKIPHTSSGEPPLFLFTGQEPTYSIDKLLPTMSREMWDSDDNTLDLSQLRTSYALARKNMCLARRKSKCNKKLLDRPLKVGDRVYRQNFSSNRTKVDLKWRPGFRIVGFESARTAVIEHTESMVKSRVNVRHLRWADPVSELINNSNIDVFPGESKLYFSASDLADLNWEELRDLPQLEPYVDDRAAEIVRDRVNDLTLQEPPPKRVRLQDGGELETNEETESDPVGRPKRDRKKNVRLRGYLCGLACYVTVPRKPNNVVCTFPGKLN